MANSHLSKKTYLGQTVPSSFHKIYFSGTDRKLNHALNISSGYEDESLSCYRYLRDFEANGNITITAFEFLWSRALMLKELRVTGTVVIDNGNPISSVPISSPSGGGGIGIGVVPMDNAGGDAPPDNLGNLDTTSGGFSNRNRYTEIVFTPERIFQLFSMNPMVSEDTT